MNFLGDPDLEAHPAHGPEYLAAAWHWFGSLLRRFARALRRAWRG